MKKIKGLLTLLRFELPVAAGICVVMGQMLALGKFASATTSVFGFFSVFFISASILVMNDVIDVETDRVNSPHRPIPSGLVTANEALAFSILILVLGLGLSYLINLFSFIAAVLLAFIGYLYNRHLKKRGLIGNLLVSFSVGMTFIFGGITVGNPYNKTVVFFGIIAALIDLGEEIAADAMDVKGDLLIDSKSIAIKYGKKTALMFSGIIFSLAVLLSIIPFILKWFSLTYLIPILIMDFLIIYPVVKLLNSKDDEGRKFIRWIYLGATFGLIFFLIFRMFNIE